MRTTTMLQRNDLRQRPGGSYSTPLQTALRVGRSLSWIVAVLVAGASAAGVWVGDLYRDPPTVEAMLRGYDLVTLAIVAPALGITLLPRFRESARAQLFRVGLLAYCAYNYALFVFGAAFNDVFLLHVAIFSLSVFALIFVLAGLDVPGLGRRFADRTPVRWIAGVLVLLAVSLGGMWVLLSLSFAVTGDVPAEPSALVLPTAWTRLGWVLDLSFLVPAYATAAVLLWRRQAWGYLIATTVLVSGTLHQLSYMTALVFQADADLPGATAFDPIEPFIALVFVGATALLLGNVKGMIGRTDDS